MAGNEMTILSSMWFTAPATFNPQLGFALFFALLIGHALADFPLQGQFLSTGKIRGQGLQKLTGIEWPKGVWIYMLSMHALIHAGVVWCITGDIRFGVAELFLHWMIDWAKGENFTNFYVDQSLHISCKIAYVMILTF
jgi:hypothetical protein